MPKKNPQKNHHEWVQIHLGTISQLTKLGKEKEALEEVNKTLLQDIKVLEDLNNKLTKDNMEKDREIKELKTEKKELMEVMERRGDFDPEQGEVEFLKRVSR